MPDIPDAPPGTPRPPGGHATWKDLAYDENERAGYLTLERDRLKLDLDAAQETIALQKRIHEEFQATMRELAGLPEDAPVAAIANRLMAPRAEPPHVKALRNDRDNLVNGIVAVLNRDPSPPRPVDVSTVDAVLASLHELFDRSRIATVAQLQRQVADRDVELDAERESKRNYEKTLNVVTQVALAMIPGQTPADVHDMMARAKERVEVLSERAQKRLDEVVSLRGMLVELRDLFEIPQDTSIQNTTVSIKETVRAMRSEMQRLRNAPRTTAASLDLADLKVRLRGLAAHVGLPWDADPQKVVDKAYSDITELRSKASDRGAHVLKLARVLGMETVSADVDEVARHIIERLDRADKTGSLAMLTDLLSLLNRKPGDDR